MGNCDFSTEQAGYKEIWKLLFGGYAELTIDN